MMEAIGAILVIWAISLALWNKGNWFVPYMLAFGVVFLVLGWATAQAQHVHPDETITDERASRFYDTWKQPPRRLTSCCSKKDCYSAKIRRGPSGLEYLHKWSGTWATIPPEALESNQVDPLDSPNTENHVCANENFPEIVYCAVLGTAS